MDYAFKLKDKSYRLLKQLKDDLLLKTKTEILLLKK